MAHHRPGQLLLRGLAGPALQRLEGRYLVGERYTFQVQFCTEGGGNTDHSWKQWFGRNRINTYFISPHNWPWDGTSSFEGNTGQVVYEWSMHYANTHTLTFQDGVQMHGFCATPLGICSKPW